MVSVDCLAETPSARLAYTVSIEETTPHTIFGLVQKEKFEKMCADGCPNYGMKWSCPPFAPSFREWLRDETSALVVMLKMPIAQLAYIKNDYLKVKSANSMLKSRLDKFLREIARRYGARYISSGSCRLCKPCNRKRGLPCAKPLNMSYSYEALGVDVSALAAYCFHYRLSWYKKGCLPRYTCVVGGLLPAAPFDTANFLTTNLLAEYQKSIQT
jgi:predicted metal-binding protein